MSNQKTKGEMKKAFCLIVVMTIIMTAVTGCRKKIVDPVNDTTPCDTTYWTGNVITPQGDTVAATRNSRFDLGDFQDLGRKGDIDGMRKMVDQHRMELTANVVAHFPGLTQPDSIHFELWTGLVKDVLSGDGKSYTGQIRNELVFRITDPKVNTVVFLACGNGMLSDVTDLEREGLTRIDFGTASPWLFVIKRGEGLAQHLNDSLQEWVRVAKTFPIPIKDVDGNVVSPEKCLTYKGKWTTLLFAGDTIDMVKGEVRNDYGRVDFERRQLETKKANKALRNKRK